MTPPAFKIIYLWKFKTNNSQTRIFRMKRGKQKQKTWPFLGLNNIETWQVGTKRRERQLFNNNSVKLTKLCDISKKWSPPTPAPLLLLFVHQCFRLYTFYWVYSCPCMLLSFTWCPSSACTQNWIVGHYFYQANTMHVKTLRALK